MTVRGSLNLVDCNVCNRVWLESETEMFREKYGGLKYPNRQTTPGQDDFLKRAEEVTVTRVAGKTWNVDPENVLTRIFNRIFKRG
jgi:hypothetical protein